VNDVPLLALVGNPVATNADPELTAIARTNGWREMRGSDEIGSTSALQAFNPFAL